MLQFNLTENLLTDALDDYMAQVTNVRVYTNEEIAERMLKRGTLLTKVDILATMEGYQTEVADIVEEGSGINTPLFNVYPAIAGTFEGAADNFDSSRHRVKANVNAGVLLRDATKRVKPQKVQVADPIPYIVEVKDIVSGSVNDGLTPAGILQLRGSRLKFIQENPDNGVFLIPETGTEIQLTIIAENKPARIMAMLPADLAAGTYFIEIRTTYASSGRETKNLKKGRYIKSLMV